MRQLLTDSENQPNQWTGSNGGGIVMILLGFFIGVIFGIGIAVFSSEIARAWLWSPYEDDE